MRSKHTRAHTPHTKVQHLTLRLPFKCGKDVFGYINLGQPLLVFNLSCGFTVGFFYTNTHPPDVNTKLYVGMGGLRHLDESSEHPADEDVSIFTSFFNNKVKHA